ncbi:MAG: ATP-binding cassette domain-containing protein [Clostridia bacterium]|nr:ATP-binding cassette domain-containing protein [Clostridia bacterium]
MLTLKNIVKNYTAGDSTVAALKGISVKFRKSEFVSVLGPSGCGKTTLLNIIGGLDRYTSGDLVINGRSTKDYKDRDWDSYRNHSVGFVFQSYNLIPHQSVLSNVELALTLSGVSKEERRRRATEALEKVGLGDQLHKRPNQMSGGQMQRVAIARALVNDPDILLADEPTGALDSETSVQIMEILKEISADKLIIMVTHNPELANTYSSRIIRLLDGEVTDDSNPYDEEEEAPKKEEKVQKKPSMSFFTAVSLSFNNLLTKKARTFLTSFAGSIGIIGIALILALSTGVNAYIDSVQKDTLSSYPISIQAETMDATELLTALMQAGDKEVTHELDKVYGNTVMHELVNALNNTKVQQNNLRKFKKWLDKETKSGSKTGLDQLVTSVEYGYDLDLNVYTKDTDGKVVKADMETLITDVYGIDMNSSMGSMPSMPGMSGSAMDSFAAMNIWTELLAGEKSNNVNGLLKEQYDVIYGSWPTKYNEVVLVVDQNNEISDLCLYALGLKTVDQLREDIEKSSAGETLEIKEQSWSYKEICGKTFRLVPSCDRYSYNNERGEYIDLDSSEAGLNYLYDEGIDVKITGIIRQNPNASSAMLRGSTIGYTPALTEYIVDKANNSELVKNQIKAPDTDVFTGKPFMPKATLTDEQKLAEIKEHLASLSVGEKAAFYRQVMSVADEEYLETATKTQLEGMSIEDKKNMLIQAAVSQMGMSNEQAAEYIANLDQATIDGYVADGIKKAVAAQFAQQSMAQLAMLPDSQAAAMLDGVEDKKLLPMYDTLFADKYSDADYDSNLKKLGYVDMAMPSSVNIFAATFEDKEAIDAIIGNYNDKVEEEDKIAYTDIMKQVMSSFTTIINAITYVLIAFVSISLVVSSIMIGIITYISVLERTKEIGVLRAIGASKRDISRVFNAETLIIGFASGAIGIGTTLLLCIPINAIIHALTDIQSINAVLPAGAAVILVTISMVLTFISGLIPSKIAARKDPVEALRSE